MMSQNEKKVNLLGVQELSPLKYEWFPIDGFC
jgi:hypothetical protein